MGGRWKRGDVIGCLLDLATCTMMVTVNGELLLNSRGSELAAKDFNISNGKFSVVIFHFEMHYHIYLNYIYKCLFSFVL